jgi:hypothetical protein
MNTNDKLTSKLSTIAIIAFYLALAYVLMPMILMVTGTMIGLFAVGVVAASVMYFIEGSL